MPGEGQASLLVHEVHEKASLPSPKSIEPDMGSPSMSGEAQASLPPVGDAVTCEEFSCLDSPTGNGCDAEILKVVGAVLEHWVDRVVFERKAAVAGSDLLEVQASVFHGLRAPPIALDAYIHRVMKYSKCSPVCLLMAYIWIERLAEEHDMCPDDRSVHRLVLVGVVIAAKLVDDKFFSNSFYAKVGGVSVEELNHMELEMLKLFDFRVHVSVEALRYHIGLLQAGVYGHGKFSPELAAQHNSAGRKRRSTCSNSGVWRSRRNTRRTTEQEATAPFHASTSAAVHLEGAFGSDGATKYVEVACPASPQLSSRSPAAQSVAGAPSIGSAAADMSGGRHSLQAGSSGAEAQRQQERRACCSEGERATRPQEQQAWKGSAAGSEDGTGQGRAGVCPSTSLEDDGLSAKRTVLLGGTGEGWAGVFGAASAAVSGVAGEQSLSLEAPAADAPFCTDLRERCNIRARVVQPLSCSQMQDCGLASYDTAAAPAHSVVASDGADGAAH